ncbi:YkuS family protein [Clostridium oryzae]|uniref:Uncharacterized protein n=1 Tax=Clostridium oryzae TaxID=1450648 RepID=A0A1V4IFI1_9CLOT|nr:YkuS family protein [Clostridium oryzae]OPJ58679.1 hypothetical protein CLORY_35130 [Clostridium oryzae]
MNIYILDSDLNIKDDLEKKGYNIIDDPKTPCDAIICNLKNCDLSKINSKINYKSEGTLIIDYGNKSVDDIENILNNRFYSSVM